MIPARAVVHVHDTTKVPAGLADAAACAHAAWVAHSTEVSVFARQYAPEFTGEFDAIVEGVATPDGDTITWLMSAVAGTPATWPLRIAVSSAAMDAIGPHTRTVAIGIRAVQVDLAVQPVHIAITAASMPAAFAEQVSVEPKVICVSVVPSATGPRVLGTDGGATVVGTVVGTDGTVGTVGVVGATGIGAVGTGAVGTGEVGTGEVGAIGAAVGGVVGAIGAAVGGVVGVASGAAIGCAKATSATRARSLKLNFF